MAKFIGEYYFCSLGEALNLFVPFTRADEIVKCEEKKKEGFWDQSIRETDGSLDFFKEASYLASVRRYWLWKDRDLHEIFRRDAF